LLVAIRAPYPDRDYSRKYAYFCASESHRHNCEQRLTPKVA
jgi:hypothetical protein